VGKGRRTFAGAIVLPARAKIAPGDYFLVARAVNAKGVATRKSAFVRFRIAS